MNIFLIILLHPLLILQHLLMQQRNLRPGQIHEPLIDQQPLPTLPNIAQKLFMSDIYLLTPLNNIPQQVLHEALRGIGRHMLNSQESIDMPEIVQFWLPLGKLIRH